MKLWVDYTNHRGERAWREITDVSRPYVTLYPPHEATSDKPVMTIRRVMTLCIDVMMVDRDARRTLKMASIKGFCDEYTRPSPVAPKPTTLRLDLGAEDDEAVNTEAAVKTPPVSPHNLLQLQLDAQGQKIEGLKKRVSELTADYRQLQEIIMDQATDKPDRAEDLPVPVPPGPTSEFRQLREANQRRQLEWQNGRDISLLWRSNELAGEVGEMFGEVVKLVRPMLAFANTAKKLQREADGIKGSRASTDDLAREIADVVICADLLASYFGIDLWNWVVIKFNETSQKQGLRTELCP